MSNFGERLAAWYLRLNGFFLVENFVLHGTAGEARTADADLLAIRLRDSTESIDGVALQPHDGLRDMLGLDRNVALIVQVKTGARANPGMAFDHDRLRRCLAFIGIRQDVVAMTEELVAGPTSNVGTDWRVAKLLIAESPQVGGFAHSIGIDEIVGFIEQRLATFRDRKMADRLFFPDELMQFLAWRAGQQQGRR